MISILPPWRRHVHDCISDKSAAASRAGTPACILGSQNNPSNKKGKN
jgi:hypothetical protein